MMMAQHLVEDYPATLDLRELRPTETSAIIGDFLFILSCNNIFTQNVVQMILMIRNRQSIIRIYNLSISPQSTFESPSLHHPDRRDSHTSKVRSPL